MSRTERPRPQVAVVALGDPQRHDDAIAVRVMGRVRTLVGEIGLARRRGRGREEEPPLGAAVTLAEPGAGQLVEWVEGGANPDRLDGALGNRRRVVLIDALRTSGKLGSVHHWHLRCDPLTRLSRIRHYNGKSTLGLQHLALWLEDELPEHGTDLIGIRVSDLSEGEGLSRSVRRMLPSICAQVAGIMIRILEEEGW